MQTQLDKYRQLKALITEKNYLEAIELSQSLEVDSFFLAIFQKINRKKVNHDFWNALFTREAGHLFTSDFMHGLLGKFWSSEWTLDQLQSFSENFPKVFCQSIRLNQLFLQDRFLEKIEPVIKKTPYSDSHLSKMRTLKNKWDLLKTNLQNAQSQLGVIRLEQLLTELIIWWENEWSRSMQHQQKLTVVHHNILKAYFEISPDAKMTEGKVLQEFKERLESYAELPILTIENLIDASIKLYDFETDELENYCYEIKHDFTDEGLYKQDNRALTEYYHNGQKLEAFQTYWRNLAASIVDQLIDTGKIKLNPKNDLDGYAYTSQIHSNLLLNYIGANTELDRMTSGFFSTIETHALSRYKLLVWKFLEEKHDVIAALAKVSVINNGQGFPIRLYEPEDFKAKTMSSLKNSVSPELIEQLIQRGISSSTDFNMLERPLIKLANGKILNLMHLTSEGNFFLRSYFNMVGATTEEKERAEDTGFEKMICQAFVDADLEAYQGTKYLQNSQDGSAGDIDIIVKEGDHALLLEVKRIKLRYDSQGIWNEREMKTNWASLQLHKAALALEAKVPELTDLLPETIKHRTSLILTPWFEYDHQYVGNYMKVSWFEILYALTEMKESWQTAPNKLKALKNLMIENKVWPHIFTNAKVYEDILTSRFDL